MGMGEVRVGGIVLVLKRGLGRVKKCAWFGRLLEKRNRSDQDSFGRSQEGDQGHKFSRTAEMKLTE